MARSSTETHPDPLELLAVVNRTERIVGLTFPRKQLPKALMHAYGEGANGIAQCVPGPTYLPRVVLELCGHDKPGKIDCFKRANDGLLRVEDPTTLGEDDAERVAAIAGNRHGLRTWLEREERPAIKAAIRARLESRKVS